MGTITAVALAFVTAFWKEFKLVSFDPVFAAATSAQDKYMAGALTLSLGQLSEDPAIMRRGLAAMVESGKAPNAGQLQFVLGQAAYQMKDYAAAQSAWQGAIAAGYRNDDLEALLAQSYLSGGQVPQGLAILAKLASIHA